MYIIYTHIYLQIYFLLYRNICIPVFVYSGNVTIAVRQTTNYFIFKERKIRVFLTFLELGTQNFNFYL